MSNNYYEDYLAKTNDNLRQSTLLQQEKKRSSSSKKWIFLSTLVILIVGEGYYLWQKSKSPQESVNNPSDELISMEKPNISLLESNQSDNEKSKEPAPKPTPVPKEEIKEPAPKPTPALKEEIKEPEPKPTPAPKEEIKEPAPKPTPAPKEEIKEPAPKPTPAPKEEIKEPEPKPTPAPKEEIKKPAPKPTPAPKEEIKEPAPKPTPAPKEQIKEPAPKHPLAKALLDAKEACRRSSVEGASSLEKIDTFNKVVLDRSIIKPNKISQKLALLEEAFETRKENKAQELEALKKSQKAKEKSQSSKSYNTALKEEAKVRKDEMQYVTVKSGDSLFKIAKRVYGDAMKYDIIFKANSDILKTKTDLQIGQKLRVPKLKEGE
jgi:nucleoid-associated protein YgaU